jgi:hypothetical protein
MMESHTALDGPSPTPRAHPASKAPITRPTQIVEEMRLTNTRTQYHTKIFIDSSVLTSTERWFCGGANQAHVITRVTPEEKVAY